ncbi:hypothetical protein, partial [Gemmatimonas sp.]|uniref:hypothetical protein n=1 Tax=Gemmatimonas sp. TaxID=1962908 RepID=UPI003340FDE2
MTVSLPASAAELLALHDALGEVLVLLDRDGRLLAATRRAEAFLGDLGAVVGTLLPEADGVPLGFAPWFRDGLTTDDSSALRVQTRGPGSAEGRWWQCVVAVWPTHSEIVVLRVHEETETVTRADDAELTVQNYRLLTAQMREMLFLLRVEG